MKDHTDDVAGIDAVGTDTAGTDTTTTGTARAGTAPSDDRTIDVQELGKANLTGFQDLSTGEIDTEWMVDILFRLLRTPSPSGRTDAVMQYIGDIVNDLGLDSTVTRQGTLIVDLPGETETFDRSLVVHADTIGCMVSVSYTHLTLPTILLV